MTSVDPIVLLLLVVALIVAGLFIAAGTGWLHLSMTPPRRPRPWWPRRRRRERVTQHSQNLG